LRKQPTQREKKDVNAVVQSVLTIIQAELRHLSIKLEVTLAPDLPAIEIVPIEIEQVILNLARNAIEAIVSTTGRQKKLVIVTRSGGDKGAVVTVTDSGGGLPPSELDNVFDPFFTTKPDGLGMGLSITRSIIEAHSGSIWVERTSSLGTTIAFSLPGTAS
jgi:signal transduction histidine kinase